MNQVAEQIECIRMSPRAAWKQINDLKAENAKLKEAIQSAMDIKTLWLYGEVSLLASRQHRDEARALVEMAEKFEQALKEKTKAAIDGTLSSPLGRK